MIYLLAEIHNKISQTGSNLSNRLEDKLTSDFFGAIRYLPFELGLKYVLKTAEFNKECVNQKWLTFIGNEKGYTTQIEFWRRDLEGEIDLLITSEETIIGIEVKYLSGLSSEDQDNESQIDYTNSVNQLARYSRMIEKLSNGRTAYLLFLAQYEMMNTVKKQIQHSIISPSVELGFMCWQDVLESLKKPDSNPLEIGQQLILKDVQALLTKKGFTRFNGFSSEVFNKPIMRNSYFEYKGFTNNETWNWSSKVIEEDVFMSTTIDKGENISNSVHVLTETYRNLELLFSELDRVGENEGFNSVTPRFLRWKSDVHYDEWLISNFIKLYQLEIDAPLTHLDMKDGYLYGVEVDLHREEGYPIISVIKYSFDYSKWERTPGASKHDHRVFWNPFRDDSFFNITKTDDIWTSIPSSEEAKTRHWGIKSAVAKEIPLVSVTSPEDIGIKIFQGLKNLPAI